jgi:hypothetical protein
VEEMAKNQIDLLSLFNQVTKTMKDSKTSLNKADTYNNDHGDHMVEIFEVITQAMKEKKNADPADQLEYAASLLRGQAKSGSGKLYAQGLNEAAKQMIGKDLDAGSIMSMMQTVLGAGEAPASKPAVSGDMLGSLLGSLAGGSKASGQSDGVDLGNLLGSLTGAGSADAQEGLDMGDLLGAGMSFLSAKQGGKSNLEAITGALVSGSQMASSPHREQSSQLVTSTMLKALTSMLSK